MLYNANSKHPLNPSDFKLLPSDENSNDVTSHLSSENKDLHIQLIAQSKQRLNDKKHNRA